ncbi:MAG: glycosyl hydrolase [Chloroflexota bacterium]
MPLIDPSYLQSLRYRCIGPTRGGRVVAIAADPVDPAVFYFGAVAGGIWKSDDGGQFWQCVSDGQLKTSSIGALQVAPSDPNVIYAGTGETTIRIDITHGDGMYKSTDTGRSWEHIGLSDTRHIGEIAVHPENPDIVYVAALGHAFKDNPERGVYRTRDGGRSWEQVLYVSERAGGVDLSLDPNNPRIIYATMWQARRKFWTIESGGPDSGIWQSMDGGSTWTNITRNKGLPQTETVGKVGVAVSPAQSGRVWAIIEAEEDKRGLYRSDDHGESWKKISDRGDLRWRPWYYMHVFAHPTDPNTVIIMNQRTWISVDGGANFSEFSTPHGDNHDLWIDPNNPNRMIGADDGGAWVSYNAGKSWSSIYNQLTAQFYHVATDNRYPYHVYGTQQDNSSIAVPSRTGTGAISWNNCYAAGTGESGFIAPHPEDHNIVYLGAIGSSAGGGDCLQKYDHRTKQIQLVTIWPEAQPYGGKNARYRFQWTYPIVFSPHNSDILYACGNVVFKTEDGGQSWKPISGDLTYAEPETIEPSGGPLTHDLAGAEMYATIFAFAACPHEANVLWTGSDDGLVHVSQDGGQSWQNVTPPDVEKFTQITCIEASSHQKGSVYLSAARHKMGDYGPYLYKTTDYGQSWTKITGGIPEDDFCRVIREDPAKRGLLFAGTELGIYVSFDDGSAWQPLQNNLPVTPIYDFVIKENDLVVGTHGRSFWILDDITPLQQLTQEALAAPNLLIKPRDTVRIPKPMFSDVFDSSEGKSYHVTLGQNATFMVQKDEQGNKERILLDAGEDAPWGVMIHYYLSETPETAIQLDILDATGKLIKTFTSTKAEKEEDQRDPVLASKPGMNRFIWDMKYPEGVRPKSSKFHQPPSGPLAKPGSYQVKLTVGEWSQTQSFELLVDPRVDFSGEGFDEQFGFLTQIRDKHSELYAATNKIHKAGQQIDAWVDHMADHAEFEQIQTVAKQVKERLKEIESHLIQTKIKSRGDVLNHPIKLAGKLGALPAVVGGSDNRPTKQSYDVYQHLSTQVDEQLGNLGEVFETDLAAFNRMMQDLSVPAVVI